MNTTGLQHTMITKPINKLLILLCTFVLGYVLVQCNGLFSSPENNQGSILGVNDTEQQEQSLDNRLYFTLAGKIVDENQLPIPEAQIFIGTGETPENSEILYQAKTDSNGYYYFFEIPRGFYLLMLGKPGYDVIWDYAVLNRGSSNYNYTMLKTSIPREIRQVELVLLLEDGQQKFPMDKIGNFYSHFLELTPGSYDYGFVINGMPLLFESGENSYLSPKGMILSRKTIHHSDRVEFRFDPNNHLYQRRTQSGRITGHDTFYIQHAYNATANNNQDSIQFVLDKASEHRILMIGEGDSHASVNNYQFLTQVLPRLKEEVGLKYLILEFTKDKQPLINEYMATGDERYLYSIINTVFPGEWGNCYEYLNIFRTVYSINQNYTSERNKIAIIFPEEEVLSLPPPDADLEEWREFNHLLIYQRWMERDRLAFNNIKYLIHHESPEVHYLIYYGSAHTQKIATQDYYLRGVQRQWLGKLLTDEFGHRTYSIYLRSNQSLYSADRNPLTIYLENYYIQNPKVLTFNFSRDGSPYDAFIVLGPYQQGLPFYRLLSPDTIPLLIDDLKFESVKIFEESTLFFHSKYAAHHLRYLTGQAFGYYFIQPSISREMAYNKWEKWYEENHQALSFDTEERIAIKQTIENLFKLSKFYYRYGNYSQALALFREILELDENHFDSLYLAARSHYFLGNYEEAMVYFNRLESFPQIMRGMKQLPYIYLTRATIYNHFQEYEKAQAETEKLLSLIIQEDWHPPLEKYIDWMIF